MDYNKFSELNNITIQDCYELYKFKNIITIINDGMIINFESEQ